MESTIMYRSSLDSPLAPSRDGWLKHFCRIVSRLLSFRADRTLASAARMSALFMDLSLSKPLASAPGVVTRGPRTTECAAVRQTVP